MIPQKHCKGIIAYLALCFGLTWALWETAFALLPGRLAFDPVLQSALIPGAFMPAVATFIVRKWITREGFGDAGLRLNLKRWPYYLAAFIVPFVTLAFIITAAPFAGVDPDFTFRRASEIMGRAPTGMPPGDKLLLFAIPMAAVFVYTPALFGEEFGWRGYLQLRLYPDSPLKAAVATGVIWGVWHYPLVLRGRHYTEDNILAGLICFPILTVLLSIIFGWVRLKSGSVWATSFAHSAVNSAGSASVLLFLGSSGLIWVGFGQPLGWIPLAVVCALIIGSGQMKPAPRPAGI